MKGENTYLARWGKRAKKMIFFYKTNTNKEIVLIIALFFRRLLQPNIPLVMLKQLIHLINKNCRYYVIKIQFQQDIIVVYNSSQSPDIWILFSIL